MKVAVHQPNYFPWLGYFAKAASADVFIFLDDVQMPQGRSYVHRTMIHAPAGGTWMSAPVRRAERQLIKDVRFAEEDWRRRHRATLFHTYRKAPFADPVMALVDAIFAFESDSLSAFNIRAVTLVADYLGLSCRFALSSAHGLTSTSDDRLIELVKAVGGDTYLSGAGGNNYQDPGKFEHAGIELRVCEYKPRPYRQFQGDGFVPGLSVLDALFNLGPDAVRLLSYGAAETSVLPA
ncbi:WbqC family protein [Azospirillum soli]|uniref:WbqC family protein n=1 Tax=Azospirillum soli TaxID=1304799 RepID=UPI001AE87E2B|nr:WbqC family protein [Azospirillum soli]